MKEALYAVLTTENLMRTLSDSSPLECEVENWGWKRLILSEDLYSHVCEWQRRSGSQKKLVVTLLSGPSVRTYVCHLHCACANLQAFKVLLLFIRKTVTSFGLEQCLRGTEEKNHGVDSHKTLLVKNTWITVLLLIAKTCRSLNFQLCFKYRSLI